MTPGAEGESASGSGRSCDGDVFGEVAAARDTVGSGDGTASDALAAAPPQKDMTTPNTITAATYPLAPMVHQPGGNDGPQVIIPRTFLSASGLRPADVPSLRGAPIYTRVHGVPQTHDGHRGPRLGRAEDEHHGGRVPAGARALRTADPGEDAPGVRRGRGHARRGGGRARGPRLRGGPVGRGAPGRGRPPPEGGGGGGGGAPRRWREGLRGYGRRSRPALLPRPRRVRAGEGALHRGGDAAAGPRRHGRARGGDGRRGGGLRAP